MTGTELAAMAASTIAACVPYLDEAARKAAGKAGEAVAGALWGKVRGALAGAGEGKAVERLEARPADPDCQGAVRAALAELLENDPALAEELRMLLPPPPAVASTIIVQGGGNKTSQISGNHNRVKFR
jgi:hypothetical protein